MDTITITKMQRLTNSRNGSPRYRLTTAAGLVFETAPDAAESYGWSPFALTDRPVTLDIDTRGRVYGINTVTD